MNNIENYNEEIFEKIKNIDEKENEYWEAREFQKVLNYTEWRKFENVINKAKDSCKNSNNKVLDHFVEVDKMIVIAKGGQKKCIRLQTI